MSPFSPHGLICLEFGFLKALYEGVLVHKFDEVNDFYITPCVEILWSVSRHLINKLAEYSQLRSGGCNHVTNSLCSFLTSGGAAQYFSYCSRSRCKGVLLLSGSGSDLTLEHCSRVRVQIQNRVRIWIWSTAGLLSSVNRWAKSQTDRQNPMDSKACSFMVL